jgi:hypothetical protein
MARSIREGQPMCPQLLIHLKIRAASVSGLRSVKSTSLGQLFRTWSLGVAPRVALTDRVTPSANRAMRSVAEFRLRRERPRLGYRRHLASHYHGQQKGQCEAVHIERIPQLFRWGRSQQNSRQAKCPGGHTWSRRIHRAQPPPRAHPLRRVTTRVRRSWLTRTSSCPRNAAIDVDKMTQFAALNHRDGATGDYDLYHNWGQVKTDAIQAINAPNVYVYSGGGPSCFKCKTELESSSPQSS